ncbi:MAG: hypothetical protein PHP44_14595 [Kiritimatiellae bacterium]|nr:hypothetical protein [Kiritimatiellia bacterium]
MLGEIRGILERELSFQQQKAIEIFSDQRGIRIGHYLLVFFGIGTAGLLGVILYKMLPLLGFSFSNTRIIALTSMALVLLIVERIRTTERGCRYIVNKLSNSITFFRSHFQRNFLFPHHWVAWILVILPLAIAAFQTVQATWFVKYSQSDVASSDDVKFLLPFAVAVLSAQVALFNFLFGQVLGRHAPRIASTVMGHPVIRLLQRSLIVLLAILLFAGCNSLLTMPKTSLLFAGVGVLGALFLMLGITRKGMQIESAIPYAGLVFSRRVLRLFKLPIAKVGEKPPLWRRMIMWLDLDYSDPHRLQVLEPPMRGIKACREGLEPLIQTAMKAIKDGDCSILEASTVAMSFVMVAYVSRRVHYFQEQDSIYSWLSDQLIGLMEEAEQASDQNMLTVLIRFTGYVGRIGLPIGDWTIIKGEERSSRDTQEGHKLAYRCMGELANAFARGLKLDRSTAASEALVQMRNLAIAANHRNKPGVIHEAYVSQMEAVVIKAAERQDSYGHHLLSEAISQTMLVWFDYLCSGDHIGFEGSLHGELANLVSGIATQPKVGMSNINDSLVQRLKSDQPLLQDLVFLLLSRQPQNENDQSDTIEGIRIILKILGDLTRESVEKGHHEVSAYIHALYDVSFIVIRGLPPAFQPITSDRFAQEPMNTRAHSCSGRQRDPCEKRLADELSNQWAGIISTILGKDRHIAANWKHSYLGYIGLCVASLSERQESWRSDALSHHLLWLLSELKKADPKSEEPHMMRLLDFCQLIAAWTDRIAKLPNIAEAYRKAVVDGRAQSGERSYNSTRLQACGYPNLQHEDFYLPPLRSVSPLVPDVELLNRWNSLLTNPDVLVSFYNDLPPEPESA